MRVLWLVSVMISGVILVPSVSHASHQQGSGGPYDFVIGHTKRAVVAGSPETVDASVSAHQDPNQGEAHGEFTYKSSVFHYTGDVLCVLVDGNDASIELRVRQAHDPFYEGKYQTVFFRDRGHPENGQSVDWWTTGAFTAAPVGCTRLLPATRFSISGNLTVHDAA